MRKRRGALTFAAVLVLGACGRGAEPSSSNTMAEESDEGWMDEAEVRVTEDPCAGGETVMLVEAGPGGHSATYSDSSAPDPAACDQAQAVN